MQIQAVIGIPAALTQTSSDPPALLLRPRLSERYTSGLDTVMGIRHSDSSPNGGNTDPSHVFSAHLFLAGDILDRAVRGLGAKLTSSIHGILLPTSSHSRDHSYTGKCRRVHQVHRGRVSWGTLFPHLHQN